MEKTQIDKITDYLYDYFEYGVDCDTCGAIGNLREYWQENPQEFDEPYDPNWDNEHFAYYVCSGCHHKYSNWTVSKVQIRKMAEEILEIINKQ